MIRYSAARLIGCAKVADHFELLHAFVLNSNVNDGNMQ